jgi:hypothetical protein
MQAIDVFPGELNLLERRSDRLCKCGDPWYEKIKKKEESMTQKSRIAGLLRRKILILDGAMGTELAKRGLPPEACPMAWSVRHPDAVLAVHGAL